MLSAADVGAAEDAAAEAATGDVAAAIFFGERGLFKKRKTERMPYDHPAFPFLNKIPKI
jgi:hypothetical protein